MTKLSISEQCRRAGIDRKTYYNRLARGETDLFAPSKLKKRPISEETRTLLKKNNIRLSTYWRRIDRGWTEFEAANVLPKAEIYKINGKSVFSQLSKYKFWRFLQLINEKGMTPEEAFDNVNKVVGNVKYYRDGMTLYSYCKKHGLSYNIEYAKLKRGSK